MRRTATTPHPLGGTSVARGPRALRAVAAVLAMVIVAVTAGLIAALPAGAAYDPSPKVSWKPTSGRVYAITRVGSMIVIGGTFTALWSPKGVSVARDRLAAFDATTGDLLPWNPGANGDVRALESSTDGATVYVGGAFTSIGGQSKSRLAAVAADTGAVRTGFTADAAATVLTIAQLGDTLYVGGYFSTLARRPFSRIGAVDASTGAARTGFIGSASAGVRSIEPSPDGATLIVGGEFTELSGAARSYLGAITPDGAATSWAPAPGCVSSTMPCFVLHLAQDDASVYAAVSGAGGRAVAYNRATGVTRWNKQGDGDVQGIDVIDSVVYAGGHFDVSFAGSSRAGIVALRTDTGAVLDDFAPKLLNGLGVFAVYAEPGILRLGGGFEKLTGSSAQRYAEFSALPAPVPSPTPTPSVTPTPTPSATPTPTPTPVTSGTLIARGADWKYQPGTAGTAWNAIDFDDSAWLQGAAELGFGDGDERTVVAKGSTTYYFRHSFTLTDPAQVQALTLSLVRDDGAAVYLNGTEVARDNLPTGTLTSSTVALANVSGAAESAVHTFTVPTALLRAGTNVVSVEVHQDQPSSSDVSFDLALAAS